MGREKIKEVLEREKKEMERKKNVNFSAAVWNHRWHFIIAVHWSLPSEHPKSTWREMVTKLAYKPVALLSPIRIYIIILYPEERRTTVRSNDTLVDTPFQLISGFCHVNQGVLCC